jgi:hypothetical protein
MQNGSPRKRKRDDEESAADSTTNKSSWLGPVEVQTLLHEYSAYFDIEYGILRKHSKVSLLLSVSRWFTFLRFCTCILLLLYTSRPFVDPQAHEWDQTAGFEYVVKAADGTILASLLPLRKQGRLQGARRVLRLHCVSRGREGA